MKLLLSLFFLASCSALTSGKPRQGKSSYAYIDESGTAKLVRESREVKKQLATKHVLLDTKGSGEKFLEKSILVSQIGSIKSKKGRLLTVRPKASEFTVWLEGKEYTSRMSLNPKTKSMSITLKSPEPKWQGTSEVRFPSGKYFCFFNQLPECLYHNYLLTRARESEPSEINFYIVWDAYPYIQEIYTRVGRSLFAPASIKFDGEIKGLFRYIVEVEGQTIFYQFSKSFDLVKVAWVNQGLTIAPPGEEIAEDE